MSMPRKPVKKIHVLRCLERLDDKTPYRYIHLLRYLISCADLSTTRAKEYIYILNIRGVIERDEFLKLYRINREKLLEEIEKTEQEKKKEKIPA